MSFYFNYHKITRTYAFVISQARETTSFYIPNVYQTTGPRECHGCRLSHASSLSMLSHRNTKLMTWYKINIRYQFLTGTRHTRSWPVLQSRCRGDVGETQPITLLAGGGVPRGYFLLIKIAGMLPAAPSAFLFSAGTCGSVSLFPH